MFGIKLVNTKRCTWARKRIKINRMMVMQMTDRRDRKYK